MENNPTSNNLSFKSGKAKKHATPNPKYKQHFCKACEIYVNINYLTEHKRTKKHKKLEDEKTDKTTIEYINKKIVEEIKELEYKHNDFIIGKENIQKHIEITINDMKTLKTKINEMVYDYKMFQYELEKSKQEYQKFDDDIKIIEQELSAKKLVSSYVNKK